MSADVLRLHIDLAALQSTFFRRLQHQLDVTKVLQIGCQQVLAEQITSQHDFGSFVPADGSQLSHEDAKAEAFGWLLRGFLRDAIEGAGLFLDECLQVCELMPIAANGMTKPAELKRVLHSLPLINHKLHLPQKLEKLERKFGIVTRFNANVLSLNKARTCVVHRLGVVSELDADESGFLKVIFQHAKFVARGEETGLTFVVDQPGFLTTEKTLLELHFVENERRFKIGERVELQSHELYDTIITLWRFGAETATAIESYAKSLGIQFPLPVDA